MNSRTLVSFKKTIEEAHILSPLRDYEDDFHKVEHRYDPLTGRVSLVGLRLTAKYKTLIGETDRELVQSIVQESSSKCFFCSDRVTDSTPRFPQDILPEGRITVGESKLFPNLFPLAKYHAIIVPCDRHFLEPQEFTSRIISDALIAAKGFLSALPRDKMLYASINANYMPPAGASALHPHFQVIVSETRFNYRVEVESALHRYHGKNGTVYWDDLLIAERHLGERYIGKTGSVEWITTFSPRCTNEVMGICREQTLLDFETEELESLGEGIARVLAYYGEEGYSSFNLSIDSGILTSPKPWSRVVLRLVTRQNLSGAYRAGEHFFQHMLDTEVVIVPPELLAENLRPYFSRS